MKNKKKYIGLSLFLLVIIWVIYTIVKPQPTFKPSDTNLVSECLNVNENSYLGKILKTIDDEVVGFDVPHEMVHYSDYSWGDALNSTTGKVTKKEILKYDGIEKSTEILNTGSSGYGKMEIVESASDLSKTLNISKELELKIKYGVYDGKLNVKESFFKESKKSSFNQYAIYKAEFINEPKKLINYSLKDEIRQLSEADEVEFLNTYGDRFVSKRISGGTALAMFELQKTNNETEERNTLFINSTNKIYGQDLNFKFNKEETLILKDRLNILNTEFQVTGGDSIPTPIDFSAFIDLVKSFRKSVSESSGNPSTLYIISEPMETLLGVDSNIDFTHIRIRQKKYLELYDRMIDTLNLTKENCFFVQKYSNYFSEEDQVRSKELVNTIANLIAELRVDFVKCSNDFRNCSCSNLQNYDIDITFSPIPIKEIPFETNYKLPLKQNEEVILLETTKDKPLYAIVNGFLSSKMYIYGGEAGPLLKDMSVTKIVNCYIPGQSGYIDLGKHPYKSMGGGVWDMPVRIKYPYYEFKSFNKQNGTEKVISPSENGQIELPMNSIIKVKLVVPLYEQFGSYLPSPKWVDAHPGANEFNKYDFFKCDVGTAKLRVTNVKPE
tara:strand:+ start:3936 stop:5765 length:1830 start_codon:yes stop_codon:yes gene_type:complete